MEQKQILDTFNSYLTEVKKITSGTPNPDIAAAILTFLEVSIRGTTKVAIEKSSINSLMTELKKL